MRYRGWTLAYACTRHRLPEPLRERFVMLDADASTRRWIDHALDRPQSRATTLMRDVAHQLFNLYDANGIAGAFSMRVLGTEQWRTMLQLDEPQTIPRLLDVGAGDGEVTAELAACFDEVVTTELSGPMARRLRSRGYVCLQKDLSVEELGVGLFDVVSLLNVLDRTAYPRSLLKNAAGLVGRGGRLVVAAPLPLRPAVLVGRHSVDPEEPMPRTDRGWESGAATIVHDVLGPVGFEVERFTRVPYLCRGDVRAPLQILDDAVFVCRRTRFEG